MPLSLEGPVHLDHKPRNQVMLMLTDLVGPESSNLRG